ncbi:MAG: hypothetical protein KIT02_10740 [Devosia sp.]|uniref:hypothetical protein n=1 Tax=Devosia sp. TaxID=1871048 RepID=UPI0024CC983F|nr:hypothetical protein [Devosia sp.]UYN98435.1 MAG: hypothetical protein KIT02_10740 [Devosia sp.]
MRKLEQIRTGEIGVPVALDAPAPRPSLARSAPMAAFVSQIIATRELHVVRRPGQAGPQQVAVNAYGRGARISERRMPLGYRKTKIV